MDNKDLIKEENLRLFGNSYVKELINQLRLAGKDASGSLIRSIDYRLERDMNDIKLFIEAEDYLEYVDSGRRPGSYPPISEISKWASIKGIPQSVVFGIARNIFKFGIEPTNVIGKTNDNILNNNIVDKLRDDMVENIEDYIENMIKK